ncbi:MAG: Dabb family protein [Chthoniobacteraceae bacterium]
MFSHIVIFWTDPANPNAADQLVAGVEKYLRPIPLPLHFHCGRMATSPRTDVVDQSYQVALNFTFNSKADQDAYQVHPLHLDFVENCKALWKRVVVYDFE